MSAVCPHRSFVFRNVSDSWDDLPISTALTNIPRFLHL